MIQRMKRSAVWVAAVSLLAGTISALTVAPAIAVANASTRLVSITGDLGTAPVSDLSTAGGVAGYYNAQLGWKDAFVTAGQTFTLTFEVRAAGGGLAASGDSVTLYANTSYSGSQGGITETGSNTVVAAAGNGSDGAAISSTVGANGLVSFTFLNTNVDADVLNAPSNVNTAKTSDNLGGVFSNFLLKYNDGVSTVRTGDNASNWGTDTLDSDIVSVHFVKSQQNASLPSIRIVSPSISVGTNATDYTSDIAQWYSSGTKSYQRFFQDTDTVVLTFQVTTDGSTSAGAGTVVKLYGNSAYSGSNASWTINGTAITPSNGGTPGGSVTQTTNSNGRVSFTIVNTDSSGFEAPPSSLSAGRPNSGRLFGTFKPVIVNGGTDTQDTAEDTDLITFDVFQMAGGGGGGGSSTIAASHATPEKAHLVLTPWSYTGLQGTAALDNTTNGKTWFIDQYYDPTDKWLYAYANAGSAVTLKWHVTDSAGTALANTAVSLKTNFGGSGSTWTATGMSNGVVTGTTDSSGDVIFVLTNTNTGTGSRPSDLTNVTDALASINANTYPWARMVLTIGSNVITHDPNTTVNQATDLVDIIVIPATGPVAQKAIVTLASSDVSTMEDKSYWWSEGNGSHSYLKMVIAGSTLTLNYHVTDETGTALSGATVTLAKTTASGGDFSGTLTGTTNSSGNVTFTLVNTNTNSQSEPYPISPSSITHWDDNRGGTLTTEVKVDFVPSVTGYTVQTRDRVWTHIVAAQGANSNAPVAGPVKTIKDDPNYFESVVKPESKLDVAAGSFTCTNASAKIAPTLAVYYLMVDNRAVAGLRFGKFVNALPLYPSINAIADGTATVTSATFKLDKSWNQNGHTARLQCLIQTGTSINTETLRTPMVQLKGVGKYKKFVPVKTWKPNKVTMRLVEPVMEKDSSGKPVNFVDMSASPVQDHWSQYYGSSDGGLGVFYKYLTAGSTTTLKYKVTDSETKKAVPFFKVWLVVNKNYGGVENASFTYENNGVVYTAAPHSGEFGETQFEGMTDANGFVTFTLVNTNTASEAEPKPAALNQEQPKSVTASCFSTITLMAHLGSDETMETKDFIWAHIVKP